MNLTQVERMALRMNADRKELEKHFGTFCQKCASCCMCIVEAPVTFDDITRLSEGLGVSYKDVSYGMLFHDENTTYLNQEHGCCNALSNSNGNYRCNVYEHRPEVCRKFVCNVLKDAKDWVDLVHVGESNVFADCATVEEVVIRFAEQIPSIRSSMRSEGSELPEPMRTKLVQILNGKEFVNLFPPKK